MRIVFMGTPDFAVPSLLKLIETGYNIVGVVTQPDRPVGRKRVLTPPPIKEVALLHNIPVYQPERIREQEQYEKVLELKPDLIVTAAFGQILPKELLDGPPLGCINVHASLLPKYRGGAPIHQAIIDGETETGITIMYMVEALDAGDIISQAAIPIKETDTVGSLFEQLSTLGAGLLLETLPKLQANEITPTPQDPNLVTFAPNIKRADELLDFNRSARQLYNQVRGLNPWPVAYTLLNGQTMKVWWSEWTEEESNRSPGEITAVSEAGIWIATGSGQLILKEIQPAGKRKMDVADFVRGSGDLVKVGERFG